MIEPKIGENIFSCKYDYPITTRKAKYPNTCEGCYLLGDEVWCSVMRCIGEYRKDKTTVVFKKEATFGWWIRHIIDEIKERVKR